jgi:hypothetical protein
VRRVLAFGPPAAALAVLSVVLRPAPFSLSDHTVFVEAGRLVLAGRSPYEPGVWADIARQVGSPYIAELARTTGVWPHPPWTAYAFVPFALLPRDVGPWALYAVLLAAGVAGALLLVERVRWASPRMHALALTIAVTFQPLVIGIRWGQLSPLLVLGFALAGIGIERRRPALIVAGALLLVLKPHVQVVLAIALAALVLRRMPRTFAATGAVLALCCGVPALVDPAWLGAAVAGYGARIDALAAYATTYALAIQIAPAAWPLVAASLITVVLTACALALRTVVVADRTGWTLAAAAVASLALAPYLWTTDHALLLVVALLALQAAERSAPPVRAAHLMLTVFVITVIPWTVFIISAPMPTQALAATVPIVAALLLAQSARLTRVADPVSSLAPPSSSTSA